MALFATSTEAPFEIFISADIPFLDETKKEALFNARSDYKQTCLLDVQFKKKPKLRKEFVLVKPPIVKWHSNGIWREAEVLDENGNVDPCKRRVFLTKQSDWGKEDTISATMTLHQMREHPLPPNPDGSPADNGPYLIGTESASLVLIAPEVEIESITFNHIPGNSDSDGIDLRTNYDGNDIVGPEWTPAGTQAVAYRVGVRPTVKVNFKLFPERLTRVKAGATETGIGVTWGIAESWNDSDGGQFSGTTAVSPGVNKGNVTWIWSATGFNGVPVSGWNDFQETEFPVYKILDKPKLPWKEGAGTQKPWVTALDFAMDTCLAKKKTTSKAALMAETLVLYRRPYRDPARYYKGDGSMIFSDYMAKTDGVNCYDSAAALTIVANLIGIGVIPYERKLDNSLFSYHCYTVFNGEVYDCCSAITPLVNGMDIKLYQQQLEPYSYLSDLKISVLKISNLK
ncbi:MAG: hypothetical protein IJW12_06415 [Opitutales bacterium]|nr:hypothetical protein [Opitutales bacterium]